SNIRGCQGQIGNSCFCRHLAIQTLQNFSDKADIECMSAPDSNHMSFDWTSQQGQITDHIQNLMANDFIGKAQFLIEKIMLSDNDSILQTAPSNFSLLSEDINILQKAECSGRRDALGIVFRSHQK